jgi:hypothetical protein
VATACASCGRTLRQLEASQLRRGGRSSSGFDDVWVCSSIDGSRVLPG